MVNKNLVFIFLLLLFVDQFLYFFEIGFAGHIQQHDPIAAFEMGVEEQDIPVAFSFGLEHEPGIVDLSVDIFHFSADSVVAVFHYRRRYFVGKLGRSVYYEASVEVEPCAFERVTRDYGFGCVLVLTIFIAE
jgi:hypothetical protein